MDIATKTGMDAPKTASKRVPQKTAVVTEDLIGNKIADKITSLGKIKSKEKVKHKISTYHQKNDSRLLMTWDCFDTVQKWNTNKSQTYLVERMMKYLDLLLKMGRSLSSVE